MDDAAAPAPWGTLLALIKQLGPYDQVALGGDCDDPAPAAADWQTIEIPGPQGHPGGRVCLRGGPPLSAAAAAAIRQLADQLQELERAQRFLHLLGRHVVHDLRTPVTIIQGYGDLLRSGKLPIAAGSGPLQAIVDQTIRLLGILQDFALASGTQVPGPHVCEGTPLAETLRDFPAAQVPADLPPVAVAPALLTDIVHRLMALARLLASPQADLTVTARPTGETLTLAIDSPMARTQVPVAQAVLDGIPPEGPHTRAPWLMRLLALQRLVASQGGWLTLQAEGDQGRWLCRLPLAGPPCPPAAGEAAPP
jgi:hypothetical protein